MANQLLKLLASNKARPAAMPQSRIETEKEGDTVTIYIYDAIVSDDITAQWWGGVSAETLVPEIRNIKGGTINLRINSPGGDVFAAQAVCQAIRDTGAKVVAKIDGYAASAATVIAAAADECEISEGGFYMIHNAWTFAMGNASDMTATAALLNKVDGTLAAQYAKKSGMDVDDVRAAMDAETWYTADEAVAAGLVDRIAEGKKAEASWNMSAYAKAPKALVKPHDAADKKMKPMKMAESDFLSSMIPHHEMAVSMAKDLIAADPQDPLREFAERIISTQAGEIELMKLWQEVGAPEQDDPTTTALATEAHRARQLQRISMLARLKN